MPVTINSNITVEDYIMALRYVYYVECYQVIDDYAYDMLEENIKPLLSIHSPIFKVGSDIKEDYTLTQQAIAATLIAEYKKNNDR
jgi:hypothetical protein